MFDFSFAKGRVFADVRDAQILVLGTFLAAGVGTRDWTLRPELLLAIAVSCLLAQWVFAVALPRARALLQGSPLEVAPLLTLPWRSAAITALGLCLLLRANHVSTVVLASVLAIASKFLFRCYRKHFFNPANFGIVLALLLSADAWVSPGQWGAERLYLLLFGAAALPILGSVGRWDAALTFLGGYAGLEAGRAVWLGLDWQVWAHQLGSGSLLLFALFMLTDPRSTPDARPARMLWALSIAAVSVVLQHGFFVTAAPFWALFAIAPLTPSFDAAWGGSRFHWSQVRLFVRPDWRDSWNSGDDSSGTEAVAPSRSRSQLS